MKFTVAIQILGVSKWTRPDFLALIGIFVSVAGFTIAIVQLRHTKSSTDAAVAAIRATESQIQKNQGQLLLSQLWPLSTELDDAVSTQERRLAVRSISGLIRTLNHLIGLFEMDGGAQDDVVQQMRLFSKLASSAKSRIINSPDGALSDQTMSARSKLADLLQLLNGIEIRSAVKSGSQ